MASIKEEQSSQRLTKVKGATQDTKEKTETRTQMVTGYNRLILNLGRQERDKRPYISCPVQCNTQCVCHVHWQ